METPEVQDEKVKSKSTEQKKIGPGITGEVNALLEKLKKENEKLQKDNEFLKKKVADKRPQIKVFDHDGLEERRKRAVALNLSSQVLPPLTKGQTATYRVIASERIDPATKLPPDPTDLILPGSFMFFDPFEPDPTLRSKLMQNFGRQESSRDGQGNRVIKDIEELIEFKAGLLTVNITSQYKKYVFMELHPLNATNKFRKRSEQAIFYRTDLKNYRSPMTVNAEMDLSMEAEQWVVNKITDQNKIIGMAVSAKVFVSGMSPSDAKIAVRKWAKAHPRDFFRMENSIVPSIRFTVMDGIDLGIVDHNHEQRKFSLTENGKELFIYAPGEDPIEAFVMDLYKEENLERLKVIQGLLDYWEPSVF